LRKYDSLLEASHEEEEVEVMLIGHSIGAWMALDILSRHPQIRKRTKHFVMLMPFMFWSNLPMLHRTKLSSFRMLHPVSHHIVTSSAQSLLYVNPQTRRRLFKAATGLTDELVSLISDRLLTKRLVQNFYTMGYDEICDVKKHESRMLGLLSDLDKEMDLFALYTDDDVWAPEGDVSLLRKTVPQATVVFSPGLTHAFSLTEQRIQKVCGILLDHFGGKSVVAAAAGNDGAAAGSSGNKNIQIRSML
jgi:pimeloyl-ACP methyl ester carboxylesterase